MNRAYKIFPAGMAVCCAISFIVIFMFSTSVSAQRMPPGFDFRMEWEHLEEQSKDRREVDVTQLGARVGYTMPQTLDIYITLSWQDMNAEFEGIGIDLDPALAFKAGAKVYVLRDIPMGTPADFTLSASYNVASHKADKTGDKYKHRRIIGAGGLEWRFVNTVPYLSLGVLYSEVDTPLDDYDQTSVLIAGGINLPIVENVFLRLEVNMCQEVGYAMGIQYLF